MLKTLSMLNKRHFSTALKVQPYFNLTHMIKELKAGYEKLSNDDLRIINEKGGNRVRTGGRIVGRRKASKDLVFLDLQSNGEQIQVMLDHTKL